MSNKEVNDDNIKRKSMSDGINCNNKKSKLSNVTDFNSLIDISTIHDNSNQKNDLKLKNIDDDDDDDTINENKMNENLKETKTNNNKTTFHCFNIILDDTETQTDNMMKLSDNIYCNKGQISLLLNTNYAIRKLTLDHNIKHVASFKIIDQRVDCKKDVRKELISLLKDGIPVDIYGKEIEFTFIGNSNSGIRDHKFWTIDKLSFINENVNQTLNTQFGDFSNLENREKIPKRFSQAFTTSIETLRLEESEFICVNDDVCVDENDEYESTDGVGIMKYSTATEISTNYLNLNYIATVIQFRFGGFKGCLSALKDDDFNKILIEKYSQTADAANKIKILFRKSQKKFEMINNKYSILNVVSWSSYILPFGTLNLEYIMVLDGLCELNKNKNLRNYLIELYKNYLKDIAESTIDSKKAYLKLISNPDCAEFSFKYASILLACGGDMSLNLEQQHHQIIKSLLIYSTLYKIITQRKFNITIEKSKNLLGVADETEMLDEDEVFVSYRDSNGTVQYLNGVSVIVGRTPCYALSEMRKVKTKIIPQLMHLENCVVFSKKGKRPLPNMLSGGDLDGDIYFVSWDENLIDIENYPPIKYPTHPTQPIHSDDSKQPLRDTLLKHFVDRIFNNNTGLWHYYITNLYNESRELMTSSEYIDSVININKCLDGHLVKNPKYRDNAPLWYYSRNDIEKLNELPLLAYEESVSTQTKLNNLYESIKKKQLKEIDIDQDSLLSIFMSLTFKLFAELMEPVSSSGRFFSDDEILLLERENKIDLSIVKNELTSNNGKMLEDIKRKYIECLKKLKLLDKEKAASFRDTRELYEGMVENKSKLNLKLKIEKEKAFHKNEFRKFVIDYPYEIENSCHTIEIKQILKHIHSDTGLYFQSRCIQLYLHLRFTKDYYLAWEFYDTLCMLKNYINHKKSSTYGETVCINTPFTMPIEYLKALSASKLTNIQLEKFNLDSP